MSVVKDVPKHVGIIMDGNRRLARRLMLKPWKGHEWGAKKVEKIFDWCRELNIHEMTLYTFSVQNFNRPKIEFDQLMRIFKENFKKIKTDRRIEKYSIKINFIGRIWMFPQDIQDEMNEIMELTKDNDNYIFNFAMAYGGQEEIIDAAKRIAEQVKEGKLDIDAINKDVFSAALYMPDEPELIIRTGGERRASNFLSFQSAYSEWFYIEKMWPEFEKEDFVEILEKYSRRKRRFGK